MSLRDLLAAAEGAGVADEPAKLPRSFVVSKAMPDPAPAPDRQLGTRTPGEKDGVIPMDWPIDAATCEGNRLAVMIDREAGWLGIELEDGRFLHLLGPLRCISVPF